MVFKTLSVQAWHLPTNCHYKLTSGLVVNSFNQTVSVKQETENILVIFIPK